MATELAYGTARLDEIQLHCVRNIHTGRTSITGVSIDGQLLVPTTEFWDDLFTRFHLNHGWAENKSYARRFEWLKAHHPDAEIPYRIDVDEDFNSLLLPRPSQPVTERVAVPTERVSPQTARFTRLRRNNFVKPTAPRRRRWNPTARHLPNPRRVTLDRVGRDEAYRKLLEAIRNVD